MSQDAKPAIPPRNEWFTMSPSQLYEVKVKMLDRYYMLKDVNATFANQYYTFVKEIENLIDQKQLDEMLNPQQKDQD